MAGGGSAAAGAFALAVAAGFAGAAHAETFTPAPNAVYVIDLDTQAGAFSRWRLSDLTGFNALRGRVTFVRKGSDRQVPPVFRVALGDDQQQAWLQITAMPQSGPLIARVYRLEGQTEVDVLYFSATPNYREPFDLKIEWTPDGRVSFLLTSQAAGTPIDIGPVQAGGRARPAQPAPASEGAERREVFLGRAPTWLLIDNSTGEVTIDPLQLGWAQP
jgi:hypothetical protein